MRKLLMTVLISPFVLSSVYAEIKNVKNITIITPQIGFHFFDEDRNVYDREKFTGGVSVDRITEDYWGFGAYLGYGKNRRLSNTSYKDFYDVAVYGSKYYQISSKFLPYISLGLGGSRFGSKDIMGLYGALGGLYFFKRNWTFNISIKDFYLFKGRNDVITTIGIGYAFGLSKKEIPTALDTDNDGVIDEKDKCPNTPKGVAVDSSGCPLDSDNDGVPDYKDKCPDTPSGVSVNNSGCPLDTDKDGVFDYKDRCPDTPEGIEVDRYGCPKDKDLDGVPDYLDKCPSTKPGISVDKNGCPLDSDKDGVPDYKDKCPDTPKGVIVDITGCPVDSDNDGVPDYLDRCPDTAEGIEVDKNGCPLDRDNDGIPDYLDKCPNTPKGVAVDKNGCALDSDNDGVPDYIDQCPYTPEGSKVDEKGCLVEAKLEIHFDLDSAKIKPEYYPEIEKFAKYLKENPDVKIEIQGHTDSLGSAEYNLKLSQKRAEAVKKILVEKFGISPDRIIAKGYGESKPIASNDTPEGRAKNRRVIIVPIK